MDLVTQANGTHRPALSVLAHLSGFSLALRTAGVNVNASKLIELAHCFEHINIASKQDFYYAAQTTLVSRREDLDRFRLVFSQYWQDIQLPGEKDEDEKEGSTGENLGDGADPPDGKEAQGEEQQEDSFNPGADPVAIQTGYSEKETLRQKDLSDLNGREIEEMQELIAQLAAKLSAGQSLRSKTSSRGKALDHRRMLRQSSRSQGDIIIPRYRRKKQKKAKLLLLCDVSGSMDRYAGFLIQFIHAVQREIPGFEVAVFSTRMSVITPFIQQANLARVLKQVGDHVQDWSGGTKIGECIAQFVARFSQEMSHTRSIVLVLSDGWDRGEPELMREEIQNLRRRVHKLIWLNPLLGDQDYQPLARGMRTALPYLDEFLAFNNLESLVRLVGSLRSNLRQ